MVYYVDAMRATVSDPMTRKSAMKELFTTLSELDAYEVLAHKTHLSEVTGIPPSKIEEWFMSQRKQSAPEDTPAPIEVKGAEHPSEAAMCSLLFHHVECRVSLRPETIVALMHNPTAQLVALALVMENVDDQYLSWTQLGDTDSLGVIARGDEICARMKGLTMAEKFRSTYLTLCERNKMWRIRELTAKLKQSQATPDELSELMRLKR